MFRHSILSPTALACILALSATMCRTAVAQVSASTPQRNVYFGDLHLHSSFSADAFVLGTRTTPDDSFNFAKGQPVSFFGRTVKRRAPLDFLALTDHAEYLGVFPEAADPKGAYSGTEWSKALADPDPQARRALFSRLNVMAAENKRIPEFEKPKTLKSVWQRYAATAERHNQPGTFTAFIAFEWTSAPGQQNLHRCVIFRDTGPDYPFTSLDSQDPEELWTYLEKERAMGRDVVAIPHNGNISNGLMFDVLRTNAGGEITRRYAERRMANEPLFEIIQEKGSSDTHPSLSPNDEFADFETYSFLLGSKTTLAEFKTGSYLRQAYGTGQELADRIGVNPFKYGIEGGTDSHSGLSSTEEFNFAGPPDERTRAETLKSPEIALNPGGLTGIWSEENTRRSLFEALKRKETFATSGGRISLRMFAGWNLPADLTSRSDWSAVAYRTGVPMGGDLVSGAPGKKPTFALQAVKDPDSANLDRVQIIKVTTLNGRSTEEVIDVLWSGDRQPDSTGRLPPVDLKTARATDSGGAVQLQGTWTDSNFNPDAQITYYARVLEVPTARWSTRWAADEGVELNPERPATIQERAWTSPIWYAPPSSR